MTNALPNVSVPSNLYSGGAVTFNAMPWINYFTQKQQRDQAKEDAFYRFFGEMNKAVTPTGMAANDIPGLMQRKNQWQQYALENKGAIAHPSLDGGKAYGQYLGLYNDMQNYIGQSTNKFKGLSTLQPILRSPQKNALLNAKTMNDIHAGALPIDHPNYLPFDTTSVEFNPQPFDIKQQNALRSSISGFKPSDDQPLIQNVGNNQQRVTHNYKFSTDQLAGLYNIGASQYDNNPSFRNMIDGIEHGGQYDQLNQAYKEHYGHDIQDEHDLSAAYVMSLHPSTQNKVETRNIPYSPWERASASLWAQNQHYDYRKKQEDKAAQEGINGVDKLMSDMDEDAKQGGPRGVNVNGNQYYGYLVPITPKLGNVFTKKDPTGKHNIIADELYHTTDGQYLPIYYQRDENGYVRDDKGNAIPDPIMSQPISRSALRASYGNELITRKTNEKALNVGGKKSYGAGGLN